MLDKMQLLTIKNFIEAKQGDSLESAQIEIQNIVYQLGGTRNIFEMSPGATALYLTILLELNRSQHGSSVQIN